MPPIHVKGPSSDRAFAPGKVLPLTPNGKIDRLALPAAAPARPTLETPFREPQTPLERTLAGIWAAALGLDEIGVDDDFLELGGDSLRAMKVVARVLDGFAVDVSVKTLLEAPTVAEMARVIARHQPPLAPTLSQE